MKIVCIGGGPAGLYFALLMKRQNPAHDITVVERNKPFDTFGWGVVFSDATMANMRRCDAQTAQAIEQAFNHWDDIELHFKGEVIRSGGHGFVGIGRKKLLNILQNRCAELGVRLDFEHDAESEAEFPDADLIVASDGINSRIRSRHAGIFKPELVQRPNRFIWLGTLKRHPAFTFLFEKTEHGWFQAHVYQFDAETSTFIVECPETVWQAHGLEALSADESIAFCERLFARHLDGAPLLSNARHLRGSAWLNFQQVRCAQWWTMLGSSALVLMGDAVHTAHFAIGSGTKLAIEDAIELAAQFAALSADPSGAVGAAEATACAKGPLQLGSDTMRALLARYQASRAVDVLRLQNAAWNAMEWFEACGSRYCDQLAPPQFMYSMLTRSQRISHENLRLRDPAWLGGYEAWFAQRAAAACGVEPQQTAAFAPAFAPSPMQSMAAQGRTPPPMFTPFQVRSLRLKNRVLVSPMAQYSCVDGMAGDYHLMHLGARAMGGAALVFAEMTCVSPDARITPACPGLWNVAQRDAWARVVRHLRSVSDAKVALQLGHAGAKGSTRVAWEGIDQPLEQGNWPLMAASAQQYLPGISQTARAMTLDDMRRVQEDFVRATRWAAEAGFDWLELHCAHGYLLSSFISPLTNQRVDEFGGSLENRLRYPLRVFKAMRAEWPAALPMSVRISAHDWVEGGITPLDAVHIARAFKAAGVDLIDCSSGQVSKREKPVFGRMFQTPFSDRIRNEAGIATIAVGAISEADHVNSIIAAGRADLCAVARPHLANPAWTLTEAARIGWFDVAWPRQYESGKSQLERNLERERNQAAALLAASPAAGAAAMRGDAL